MSLIVDDLRQTPMPSGDETLAFFYCDPNNAENCDARLLLSSFVKQLAMPSHGSCLHASVVQSFKQKQQTGFGSKSLDMREFHTLLASIVNLYSQTTLIVDALDECNQDDRENVLNLWQ
jgi:hypothetical protein